jgi:hypothetical protein
MKFAPQGMIFPVSAAILNRIEDYRKSLEVYSHPLLNFIVWKQTEKNNVRCLMKLPIITGILTLQNRLNFYMTVCRKPLKSLSQMRFPTYRSTIK